MFTPSGFILYLVFRRMLSFLLPCVTQQGQEEAEHAPQTTLGCSIKGYFVALCMLKRSKSKPLSKKKCCYFACFCAALAARTLFRLLLVLLAKPRAPKMLCIAEQEQEQAPAPGIYGLKLFGRAQLRIPNSSYARVAVLSLRLSNPYEGKKVKTFAKEKVRVQSSRVLCTLKGSLSLRESGTLASL